jgi:hypothetical protein
MKKLIFFIALTSFLGLLSCNSGTDKKTNDSKVEKSESIKDCDDFLTHYEEWVDEYIEVIDSYLNNPGDETIATNYMDLMQEAMVWSTKWVTLVDCAENEEYEQRFEDIAKEVENKLQEIGL